MLPRSNAGGLITGKQFAARRKLGLDWCLVMAKISLLVELWHFMRYRKKWWLAPILFILVLLGIIIVFAESSALAPFLYPLF